jgi:hypothetical protein
MVGTGVTVIGARVAVAVGAEVALGSGVGVSGVTDAAAVPVSKASAVCARLVARSLTEGLLLPELPHASSRVTSAEAAK